MQPGLQPYRNGNIRFLVLALLSLLVFGNQYAFNNPQALEDSMEKDLSIGETQFQLLYTIFAFPNIFATLILGFLIDMMGVRIGIIALSACVAVFQLVIAIGGYAQSYTTILVGRMLFGLASESLITAQASMVSFWFKGKQLAFALGIAITSPQLGNALNSYLTPIIYEKTESLGTPLLASVFFCAISMGCGIIAAGIDKRADEEDQQHHVRVVEDIEAANEKQQIKCSDLKLLRGSFWLIVVLCMFAEALYIPFLDGANRLYQVRFCFTQVTSGRALMVTYIVAAAFSAPLGILIDRVGYKRYFIMGAMLIFTVAQTICLLYPQCQGEQEKGAIAGLFLIGLGYCFYGNCILPSIPLVVKKRMTGTAFGIMQMIMSIALAIFPLINGALIEHGITPEIGYRHSSLLFVCIGLLGMLTSLGLLFLPGKDKRKLDHCSQTRMHVEERNGEILFSETETEPTKGESDLEIAKIQQSQYKVCLLNGHKAEKL